jgi:hypothetical protein
MEDKKKVNKMLFSFEEQDKEEASRNAKNVLRVAQEISILLNEEETDTVLGALVNVLTAHISLNIDPTKHELFLTNYLFPIILMNLQRANYAFK